MGPAIHGRGFCRFVPLGAGGLTCPHNGIERLNKEIKRQTRVATLFPSEASLLRLVSAVLSEISDDWETEPSYLNMEACWPAPLSWHLQKRGWFIRHTTSRQRITFCLSW